MQNKKKKNERNRQPQFCNQGSGALLTVILAVLMLASILFTGCAVNRTILHPLEQDFISVKQGSVIPAPKDGFFMSAYYLSEVLKAEVEQ